MEEDGIRLQLESVVNKHRRALTSTDYKVTRAYERGQLPSEEWIAWRNLCRDRISNPQVGQIVPEEPDFNARLREASAREGEAPIFPRPEDKMADWVDVEAEENLKPGDLLDVMRSNPEAAEQVVRKLTRSKRKKFTELLNVEQAELLQERGGPREDLKREGEIERLLDLFARVGEM
jgi:hypothetical protein